MYCLQGWMGDCKVRGSMDVSESAGKTARSLLTGTKTSVVCEQ